MNLPQARKLVIGAIAAHSLILGLAMLIQPIGILHLCGWEYDGPVFFPAQSGIFLVVLGSIFLVAIWQRPFAWVVVATKAAAVLFLVTQWLGGTAPTIVLLAALVDGLMGTVVGILVTWEALSREGRKTRQTEPS